jgi:MFS family permease
VLVSAAIGAALTPLNSTMVAVALPALSLDFGAPASSVTVLVVTGYLVATLVFQMPAGNIADRVGYARALTWGRWIFGAGAAAGVFAPTLAAVVGGRLLMAAGGALIMPTAFALLRIAVPAERQPRAFGTMGAVLGGAAAIGPAIGAWMVAQFGWRSLFVINLPLLVLSWLLQPPVRAAAARDRATPFDWQGSLLVGAALVLLTFSTRTAAPLAYGLAGLGAVLLAGFLAHERRAPSPVLDMSLFGQRGFVLGAGIISTQNLAMYSLLIQVPFMFGSGTGSDPRLGLAIIAMTATMALTSPVGGYLVEWLGVRAVVASGGLLATSGVVTLGWLPSDASAAAVGARLLLVGLGLGLSTGPANVSAIAAAPRHQSAGAAATVSMMRYVGSITGTVVLSFVFAGGAGTAARHHAALWVYVAALALSTLWGLALPPLEGTGRLRRG